MLRHDYWNQWPEVILGAEGDGDEGDGTDGEGDDSDDDSDDDDGEGEGDQQQKTAADVAALQEVLNKERRANKKLLRENARLKNSKTAEQQQELDDLETARQKEQQANSRAEKLASQLLKRDIDAAIEKAARAAKFIDATDAINGVDRNLIAFDQDDEDPTDIDIDYATVESVVKGLAAKKPHFISRGTDDGEPTGSAFGGSKKKKPSTEDAMRELYPSL